MSALRQFEPTCNHRAVERKDPRESTWLPLEHRAGVVNYMYMRALAAGRKTQRDSQDQIQESDRRHVPELRQSVEGVRYL